MLIENYPFSFFEASLKSVQRSKLSEISGFVFAIGCMLSEDSNKLLKKMINESE